MRKLSALTAALTLAAGGLLGIAAATPAAAATPGSACTITIDRLEIVGIELEVVHVTFPGTVSNYQASTCIPNTPIVELENTNLFGADCNQPLLVSSGLRLGYTSCPN